MDRGKCHPRTSLLILLIQVRGSVEFMAIISLFPNKSRLVNLPSFSNPSQRHIVQVKLFFWGLKKVSKNTISPSTLVFFQDHKFSNQPTLSESVAQLNRIIGVPVTQRNIIKEFFKGPIINRQGKGSRGRIDSSPHWRLRGWDYRSNFRYTPWETSTKRKLKHGKTTIWRVWFKWCSFSWLGVIFWFQPFVFWDLCLPTFLCGGVSVHRHLPNMNDFILSPPKFSGLYVTYISVAF